VTGTSAQRREHLVVFTRYPEPGATKTRLIPTLGAAGAADLQRRMTAQTLATVRRLAQGRPVTVEVRFEGGGWDAVRQWIGPAYAFHPQGAGDLGDRMRAAFEDSFRAGAERTVLIGSDCPGIAVEHLRGALDRLREHDLVLGPARDGGYYLIGARGGAPDAFAGVPWGTDAVLSLTLAAAKRAGLSTSLLDLLTDVDRPEDLSATGLAVGLPVKDGIAPRISVIVPVLNEADQIEGTLGSAQTGRNVEVIVVDGGSRDATVDRARHAGACVLAGPACRAVQMNLGAVAAGGDALLFLHGDTRLPEEFDDQVRDALADPDVVLGAFELGIEGEGNGLRFTERRVNRRSRRKGMPYGDQALFMSADAFRRAGGFREIAIMEDYALVKALGREGGVRIVPAAVRTSARRWRRHGVVGTAAWNALIVAAYRLGVAPDRLARWYRGQRASHVVGSGGWTDPLGSDCRTAKTGSDEQAAS
jgi:rSAM/selenodomain-associated transferase 2/rSAM/selenodomain-associated transferase 1